ncbi:hypothetical protein CPB86DRAFT_811994 [Serendipita vermifera]|nr:hypothetical protein CPB86DRAFT_811994 [Serendipita vermifera]
MEKDLRLQSFEDPYSSLRRDRSRSSDPERRRDRADARYRDVSPDTKARTLYNAQHLKYPDERPQVSRIRSEHHNSGYYTDAQPSSMMRRSSTATAAPSSTRSSRSNQAAAAAPAKISSKGFYNRRGDQYLGDGGIIRQPREFEYSSAFASYPEVGKGFANSYGTVIDVHGRILARCG